MAHENKTFRLRRNAGVLLHITSLPSGDLGDDAVRFAHYLREAGQRSWQIMPLGPPGPGDSPYAARSAFAGNPQLLSLQRLAEEGLVTPDEVRTARRNGHSDAECRRHLLRIALRRFEDQGRGGDIDDFERRDWVKPYALWAALRERFQAPWWEWPEEHRTPARAFAAADDSILGEARFEAFVQLMFEWQWQRLRHEAHEAAVTLIGDLPIFVDRDSADAWAHPEIFKLDLAAQPTFLAGVPPDAFSSTGQFWGNPVYDWQAIRKRHYAWWIGRMKRTFELVDMVRLDHFRGFEAAWEIPAGSPTAESGAWSQGPGIELFAALEDAVGKGRFIVEDLGMITDEVRELRAQLGYPGMAVLQFAFGDRERTFENPYLPHNHAPEMVVYTGTHDNDTTRGWYERAGDFVRGNFHRYLGHVPANSCAAVDELIRMAYASPARLAVVPMQDVLQLGTEARMNMPGVADGNWRWSFQWEQLRPERTAWLRALAETYERSPV